MAEEEDILWADMMKVMSRFEVAQKMAHYPSMGKPTAKDEAAVQSYIETHFH